MKYFKVYLLMTMVLGLFTFVSCGDDDEPTITGDTVPVSSFQLALDAVDFNTVAFTNFSQDADTYLWDFGDGNSSRDENPTHTYAAPGDYTVTLTASNSFASHTSTKMVTISDPNAEVKKLTGETSKVWKLSRNVEGMEYPLQVGPDSRTEIWWAYGLSDPIGARPCLMEEEYIFNIDGTYTYDAKGSVFADFGIWSEEVQGQCIDETQTDLMVGPNDEDLSAWASGDFTYNFDPTAGTLTVNGLGAHIGLPKVGTNGEFGTPQGSVEYTVTMLETEGSVDKLVLETTIDGGYWQFFLVSYDNPADEPALPGAPPTSAFGHVVDGNTVTFTNNSVSADSYVWDFGDGTTSMEENPTHTYSMDGTYTVTLTATNGDGSTTNSVNVIISSNAFTASSLHGDGSKSWTLIPAANALAVGSSKGSGEWFATTAEDVVVRGCAFDDTYTFDNMGAFDYNTNGDMWGEVYMGIDPEGCISEDMLPDGAAAWGSGNHTYTITEGDGDIPAFLTVTGTGAYIGLAKAYNGGEYVSGPPVDSGSVTYEVLSYVNDGMSETLVLTLDISADETGGAYWTFTLVSQ